MGMGISSFSFPLHQASSINDIAMSKSSNYTVHLNGNHPLLSKDNNTGKQLVKPRVSQFYTKKTQKNPKKEKGQNGFINKRMVS